jgi:hypothetical protein
MTACFIKGTLMAELGGIRMRQGPSPQTVYRIRIEGQINPEWSAWLNGLNISVENSTPPITVISGVFVDQPGLRGVINKIWDLNLSLISLERILPEGEQS